MTSPPGPPQARTAATIERLNVRLGVVPDDDVGVEDWPAAMSDPSLIEAALDVYDSAGTSHDERALIVELLFNTFEFCSIERDGNPDWRRTLDRIERDFALHEPAVRRWAEPEDGNPWLISSALAVILAKRRLSN